MTARIDTHSRTLTVVSPFDGAPLGEAPLASLAEAQSVLGRASGFFAERSRWLPLHKRREYLEAWLRALEPRAEELAVLACREGGKPISDSRVEVARGLEGIREVVRVLCHRTGRIIPMGHTEGSAPYRAWTECEPRGVVLGIGAFNHPFNLIVHQLAPALAAGSPIVLKPSLDTPLSCLELVKALAATGIDSDFCQVLLCDNETTRVLAADPRVSLVHFVGSSRVGWALRLDMAPGTECVLEHGGCAPVIVDKGFPFATVIPSLVRGSFYHAGQVCISVQRIFVHRSDFEAFCGSFVRATGLTRAGDPMAADTLVGPLIRASEVQRVREWIAEAVAGGATLACGGQELGDTVLSPAVLLEPPSQSRVSADEVFGPVVCLYAYDDLPDAVARANAVRSSFQSSFFSYDLEKIRHVTERLEAATVLVNEHTAFRVDWMPFGGYRDAGLGSGDFQSTMAQMSREKLMIVRHDVARGV